MKLLPNLLAVAVFSALSAPAFAEVELDVIGGSEVSFEGLIQADYNKFNSDLANLNGDVPDGRESDQELRRAEIILKGKGPGQWTWVVGYDAKADKFLDVNVQYKFTGFTSLTVGQYKQPNSLEELQLHALQRLHLEVDDHQPAGRRPPHRRRDDHRQRQLER